MALTGLIIVLGVWAAQPALAHGAGSEATGYDSRIIDAPEVPGVFWQVYGGDEMLGVTNTGPHEITVIGYDDEPYLRVGPDAVWQNRRSPAAYLNEDRYAQAEVPAHADADADPDWQPHGEGPTALWHDHRIHWMSPDTPPQVTDRGRETMVFDWQVPVHIDGEPATISGELWWIPGPSPWPWLVGGLILALPALAGLAAPASGEKRWASRPAAAVVGVTAVANVTRLVDDLAAAPLPLADVASSAAGTALFIAVGLYAALRGWRGHQVDVIGLAVGAAILAVAQGLADWSVLTSSQLTTTFPDWVPRLVVALSIAQGPVVIAAAALAHRRLPSPITSPTSPQPQPAD